MKIMSDTKILQAILDRVKSVDNKVDDVKKDINVVKEEAKNTEERLTERIDKLGIQLARLEDDAPTVEEFKDLKHEVTKIQKHLAIS